MLNANRSGVPRLLVVLGGLVAVSACVPEGDGGGTGLTFDVTLGEGLASENLDGRLLILIADSDEGEPRFQVSDNVGTAQVFGVDVEDWATGEIRSVGAGVFGYPVSDLSDMPAGTYRVQAFLNRYETFTRSDGHTVKLPPDRGEGQQWARKPGNLYTVPAELRVDPAAGGSLALTLTETIAEIPDPPETPYIKHVRIRSDLLSEFWGTDMYLGAHVLLPHGFDEHPQARYPLAVFHGHFPYDFGGWRETPPDLTTPCVYSTRFDIECYNHVQDSAAYALYQEWTGPDFPRMIVIEIQHANPYYDDSYAVNSENLGPYGDAITYELIPEIERRYRGIGEGWSRFLYGGSTGGWEAMAAQVKYPDDYNGAFVACPDPIDFRAYTVVNIYEDENAYYLEGPFTRTARPGRRDYLGHVSNTLEASNHRELALATNSRSGDQWDIWQAVYSPVGDDGYPTPIWDKRTGEIDHEVAEYWRENYDLVHILRRDWETLGPKLQGKLNIFVGDMDNYYLNNAVYLAEDFLESTTTPYYDGRVDYGDRAEHCWNGDHTRGNGLSRLRYVQQYVPDIVRRIERSAPPGADIRSWRY